MMPVSAPESDLPMRRLVPALLTLACLGAAEPVPFPREAEVQAALTQHLAPHPRLFWSAAEQADLPARLAADPALAAVDRGLLRQAENALGDPAPTRTLEGNRLLGMAQMTMKRLVVCAYAWRRTGEARFLARVQADLDAVMAFTDWNPGHFLDVAVLAHGVAVAYDWCHGALGSERQAAVRTALRTKAFAPASGKPWWLRAHHNWNQVCHGGLGLAALAMAEDAPEEAARVLARAIDCLPAAMATYGPDGAYPEGPSYWAFGTTYNVLLLDGLTTALGQDFGLTAIPGFLATGDYFLHATGPSGDYFRYSDCNPRTSAVPAAAWFAARLGRSELTWNEWTPLERLADPTVVNGGSVWNPDLAMWPVWAARMSPGRAVPAATHWSGQGATPTAYHRSGWTPEATWVALKGGSPRTNHGHMDVGAFAMDALGVRWADDLGMQDYRSLEKAGLKIWEMGATSDRWKVFRLGAMSHSVLTVDGQPQGLAGSATILRQTPSTTVIEQSPVYAGQLAEARRGVALAGTSVVVQDDLRASGAATVRWAMLTQAAVRVEGSTAVLTREGRTLTMTVSAPAGATLEVWPAVGPATYDAPNPGAVLVGFRTALAADATATLRVTLVPAGAPAIAGVPERLSAW